MLTMRVFVDRTAAVLAALGRILRSWGIQGLLTPQKQCSHSLPVSVSESLP